LVDALLADIVAKVPNRGATIFLPEDKTGRSALDLLTWRRKRKTAAALAA
jgi:hypothetical protein